MICPRCHHQHSEEFFHPPMSLCLLCYSTNRGNENLTLQQLRDKIDNSKLSRHDRLRQRQAHIREEITASANGAGDWFCYNCHPDGGAVEVVNNRCHDCGSTDVRKETR